MNQRVVSLKRLSSGSRVRLRLRVEFPAVQTLMEKCSQESSTPRQPQPNVKETHVARCVSSGTESTTKRTGPYAHAKGYTHQI